MFDHYRMMPFPVLKFFLIIVVYLTQLFKNILVETNIHKKGETAMLVTIIYFPKKRKKQKTETGK